MTCRSGIRLRPGHAEDLPALQHLLAVNGLAGDIAPGEGWVAEEAGRVVGFIRLEVAGQQPYIRPVVVAPSAQGRGIGRLLIEHVRSQFSELRVVARGQAVGFYDSLGFKPVGWENIPLSFYQECEVCPELAQCRPQPLKWINETE